MLKKLLVAASLLLSVPAFAQNVQYVTPVTRNHIPVWNTNGVIADGGSSADSPISSIGITNNGSCGLGINTARQATGNYEQLCLGVTAAGAATISLQNFGTAPTGTLSFVINGVSYSFPGSLANITVGTTPVIGGTTGQCLYVSGGVVGQQTCTLSAITSLTGDVTATGPGISTATLAASGVTAGTYGSSTLTPIITVDAKGRITSVTTTAAGVTVGSTVVTSGTTNGLLYDNGSVLGNLATLSSGVLVTSAGGVPSIATTLPSGLTIPSPTVSGTPLIATIAGGSAAGSTLTLESTSNGSPSGDSVTIDGTTITLQNPANAVSTINLGGSAGGAVTVNIGNATDGVAALNVYTSSGVKQIWVPGAGATTITFPATTTTLAGLGVAETFSANQTFSAQAIHIGTSAPASAGGNSVVMGTIASPTLSNTGQAFLYNTLVNGGILQGDGSTNDVSLFNKSGTLVLGIPTGTTKLNFPSLSAGTCSGGLALDSGNNLIVDSCPGASASIQVGTTAVNSGTNNYVLTTGTGTLANVAFASQNLTPCTPQVTDLTTGGGSGTYTTPTCGGVTANTLELFMVGGGGGAGGGGNGSGSVAAGGNTCWNTTGAACTTPLYQAGGGGAGANSAAGGIGGAISGSGSGDAGTVAGGAGGGSVGGATAGAQAAGGLGGNSCLGGGGAVGLNTGAGGNGAPNSGAGGGGGGGPATSATYSGSGGGSGACFYKVISSPAGTYTYAVANTAAGGTFGTGGGAGGNGAAGEIRVIARWQ